MQGILSSIYRNHPVFDKQWVESKSKQLMTGILLLAVLEILITVLFERSYHPIFGSDNGTWAIATNLVHGNGYTACDSNYFPFCSSTSQVTAMREPVPVFLMAIAMLIYPSIKSGLVMQSLLFLGTIPVIYEILKNYDRRAALLASLLWVMSTPVFGQITDDSGELASAFFLSLGLLFFMKGSYAPSKKQNWIFSGIFMGMAALSRTVILGTSIGLGLSLLAYLVMHGRTTLRQNWMKQIVPPVLFLASLGFVYTPWVLRNSLVFETPVIGSTLTGYNVYRMNFIVAQKPFSPHYVGSKEGYVAVLQLIKDSHLKGNENEAQMQSLYMHAGIQLISKHPVQYLRLSLYRFLSLWFNASVDRAYGIKSDFWDLVTSIEQALLLIAVMVGFIRNRKEVWPFMLILTLGSGAYMAIDAQLRYLVDFMPVVVILSALVLTTLPPNFKYEPV